MTSLSSSVCRSLCWLRAPLWLPRCRPRTTSSCSIFESSVARSTVYPLERMALVRCQSGWWLSIGSRSVVGLNSLPNSSCVCCATLASVLSKS